MNGLRSVLWLPLIGFVSLFWLTSEPAVDPDTSSHYQERYRPQYHFTPPQNWMNDPNGMVYFNGEYHLFYQYNPYGIRWGHMSWGHAVSTDLVHWQHLPVALEEDNGIMIFSGSAVIDRLNSSGFGKPAATPMVAVYTGHRRLSERRVRQDQRIAYSLDRGRQWTKYDGNPVIDERLSDFRDPKVFWHRETNRWIMAVALATRPAIRFYGSDDLKNWDPLSDFGPAGSAERLWECPELFRLPVDGDRSVQRWILQVDVNPGGPAGGSGAQYFIGHFDGERFYQDPDTRGKTLWVDHGADFYAVQSFNNMPESDERRIWIGWMNNWKYAESIPTDPWRGAMTIPREVGLISTEEGIRLVQNPVQELKRLRGEHHSYEDRVISPAGRKLPEFNGKAYEIIAEWEMGGSDRFGFKVRKGNDEQTVIGYDVMSRQLYLDRTKSGNVAFDSTFASIERAPMQAVNDRIRLHIFVDWSSVEVFGNRGEVAITDRIFPSPSSRQLELFSEGGEARVISMDLWKLESAW
ncbi:MAG: glycoside hydrolase family 32 protein [Balneolaceae bacterium]|nr:glycoside hydrolase family 32 protein [Balneolaceae bacterium]